MLWPTIYARLGADLAYEAKLCCQDHVGTTAFDRLADLHLRVTINIGGIKKRDAQIQCAPDQCNRRLVIADAARVDIGNAQAHAPEANGRDAWPQAT